MKDIRFSRRFWWGAGVFFLCLASLCAWVFRSSMAEQRRRAARSAFGPFDQRWTTSQIPIQPNAPGQNPAGEPHVQESLKVVNEINRINEMNNALRKNNPPQQPSPKGKKSNQP